MKTVYIAMVKDQVIKERSPYIYGVFYDDHAALDHFETFGDKDCELTIISAHLMDNEDVADSIAALMHK